MRFYRSRRDFLSSVAYPRDGARVRPAVRSVSVVRQLWWRRERLLELRISHPRAMPGDRERHRRILQITTSSTIRDRGAARQRRTHSSAGSRAFDTYPAHPAAPDELIYRELFCRCTTH